MGWRKDLADHYSEACDVHMMRIPVDLKIDRSAIEWWNQPEPAFIPVPRWVYDLYLEELANSENDLHISP